MISNGYPVLLSGVSTHALPRNGYLLLRVRCCEMCLPVCYLAMDVFLLLGARWLERVYLFVS
jgi:hypothetical protein